jgi:hypothetical protein
LAVVHPFGSAGRFETDEPDSAFRVDIGYLDASYLEDTVIRDWLEVKFPSAHRLLHAYLEAVTDAGLPSTESRRDSAISDPCGAGTAMAANAAIPARPRGQAGMAAAVGAVNAVRAEPIRGDCRQIDCQSEGRPPGTKGRGDVGT